MIGLLLRQRPKLTTTRRLWIGTAAQWKHTATPATSDEAAEKKLPALRTSFSKAETSHSIIDSRASALPAIQKLLDAPFILIDGEGHFRQSFDKPAAGLSLLQFGTPDATDVYLFDMIALASPSESSVLQCLGSLLSNRRVLKVGWGGSEDLQLLEEAYGIKVEPYLDLQVVDIHSRIIRREGYDEQVKRLSSVNFPPREVRKLQIDGIHALSRLDEALQEHKVSAPLKESERLLPTIVTCMSDKNPQDTNEAGSNALFWHQMSATRETTSCASRPCSSTSKARV